MTPRTLAYALCLSGLLLGAETRADVVVITHPDSPVQQMTPGQVSDLYLGRLRSLPDGNAVRLLELPRDCDLRARFFQLLNGMSLKQVNAYWARLQFSGQILPPPALPDGKTVLKEVRSGRATIGYLDASEADDTVRIVLRLKDG